MTIDISQWFNPRKITENIYQNGYIGWQEAEILKNKYGVTDILNLDMNYLDLASFDFLNLNISQILVHDVVPMNIDTALTVVESIYKSLSKPNSKIYIHCNAGLSRSPTAIWLYFISIGIPPNEASEKIWSVSEYLAAPEGILVKNINLDLIKNKYAK